MTNFTTHSQGIALNKQSETVSINKRPFVRALQLATMAVLIFITTATHENRIGYSAGLVLDINIPVVGLGVEASAMYTHRDDRLFDNTHNYKRHYIEIPVYARYRLTLPKVERIVAPYVFTGPNFSILFKDDAPTSINNSRTCTSWDVGAGVDMFKHLRLSATYGIGMSKAMQYIDREYDGGVVNGKDKHWTLSAAWLF